MIRSRLAYMVNALAVIGILLVPVSALAHKVYVFAWVEAGMVHTESSFGDKKVIQGEIQVVNDSGTVLLTGRTNDQGEFSFPIPERPDKGLTIQLEAGMGHRASWTLSAKDLSSAASEPALENAMQQKADLEKSPGYRDILSGLGVIFGLAFAASVIHKARRKTRSHD